MPTTPHDSSHCIFSSAKNHGEISIDSAQPETYEKCTTFDE